MIRGRVDSLANAPVVLASCGLLLVLAASGFAQAPAAPAVERTAALAVAGDVPTPITLTAADLKAMPRTRVEAADHGRTAAHEGVLVSAILERAGVPMGGSLRGPALATGVIAHASDGYRVVFSVGELDPMLTKSEIIVADTTDGAPLEAQQGPLRLVVPKDTRGARSVRMLIRLEVVNLAK